MRIIKAKEIKEPQGIGEDPKLVSIEIEVESGERWNVPTDETNSDYQEYLKWLSQGNKPEE